MRARTQNGYWVFLDQHEGLISFEIFEKMQARLKHGEGSGAQRHQRRFPLRGFILCNDCGKPLTAGRRASRKNIPTTSVRRKAARATSFLQESSS